MSDVTLTPKRYVYRCAACGLLDASDRSDRIYCSTACRVRAHRNGYLEPLRHTLRSVGLVDEETGEPRVAFHLQYQAVAVLRPDLCERIQRDEITVKQAMPETYSAYLRLVREQTLEAR